MVSVTIEELKDVIRFNVDNGLHHPIIGMGAPGIGKSECVKEVAAEKGYRVIDVRLAQMSEVELGGLIFPSEDKRETVWLRPEWFPKEGDQPAILLLDELTSAPKKMQVAAYQLVLDRRINKHVLPDSTVVVAMGNGADDGAVYVDMSSALANRLEIYDVQCDASVWLNSYARVAYDKNKGQNVHPMVVSYVSNFPSDLHTMTEDSEDLVFASPRSWKRVSDTLKASGGVISSVVKNKIYASVGEVVGAKFVNFVKKYSNFDLAWRVVRGESISIPSDRSDLLFLVDSLNSIFNDAVGRDEFDSLVELYNRMVKFAGCLPGDYGVMLIKLLSQGHEEVVAAACNKDSKAANGVRDSVSALTGGSSVDGDDVFL